MAGWRRRYRCCGRPGGSGVGLLKDHHAGQHSVEALGIQGAAPVVDNNHFNDKPLAVHLAEGIQALSQVAGAVVGRDDDSDPIHLVAPLPAVRVKQLVAGVPLAEAWPRSWRHGPPVCVRILY